MSAFDALSLVTFIYEVGNEVVERCQLVKQCHSEAGRIAVRIVSVLGSLEEATGVFSGQKARLDASLIELKYTLDEALRLVKVCRVLRMYCFSLAKG